MVKLMIHAIGEGWTAGIEVEVPLARILDGEDLYDLFREKIKEKLKEIGG